MSRDVWAHTGGAHTAGANTGRAVGRGLEGSRHLLHGEAFDDVARFQVVIIGEAHAAFLASRHLIDVILEALELG